MAITGERALDITVQVSLYPLKQVSIGPTVRDVVRVFRESGLRMRPGEMSTLVWGEAQTVFAALQTAFQRAAERGETVMVVTLSNACPTPEA